MERAWPFEDKPEPSRRLKNPADFIERYGDKTEAVLVRIGLHDTQLVLVDSEGRWQRWVYHSWDEASQAASELGVTVHENEYPEVTRVRMNSYRRPAADFDKGAYPEQGSVGPVIEYPENRPRREDARKEADPAPKRSV
jgi:hypothetical protein